MAVDIDKFVRHRGCRREAEQIIREQHETIVPPEFFDLNTKDARQRRAVFAESYSIAGQLMALRVKRKLTQAQLAALTGVAQSEISGIERGVVRPTDATLVRLANAMSADVRIVERAAATQGKKTSPKLRKPTKRSLVRV